jgi:hypothetical protein
MPKLIYHDSDGIDKTVALGSDPVLIGRATECQVQTQDAMVSRRHARIFWDGNYWIEDLGSSNGVYVGNDKVQKAPFRIGDTVTCGSLVLRLMPDTTPRQTGMMTGQQQAAAMRGNSTPPVGSNAANFASTMPPPAPPPPPTAPPQATRAGDMQIGPNAVLRGAAAQPAAATGQQTGAIMEELRQERQRREQAEAAVLTANERAQTAEAKLAELEALAKDASLLKRKLDQAQADLRRMRGGAPAQAEEARDDGEAQRLRARVAELEADLAAANAKAQALTASLASASSSAAPVAAPPVDSGEAARLKRQGEQLQAELRRAKGQAAPVVPEPPPPSAPAKPAIDPEAADAAIALGDSLAELRSSLRAANDEAGLLTAPSESVAVVGDALKSAAEQLETARGHLRALGKLLGVS